MAKPLVKFDFNQTVEQLQALLKKQQYGIIIDQITKIKNEQFLTLKQEQELETINALAIDNLNEVNYQKYLANLNRKQLLKACLVNNEFNEEVFNYFCDLYIKSLTLEEFNLIQNFLINPTISNLNKFNILTSLKDSAFLTNKVSIFNQQTKEIINLIIKDFTPFCEQHPYFVTAIKIIENHFFKSPSLAVMGTNWLNKLYIELFGVQPTMKASDFANDLIKQIEKSFN